MAAGRSLAEPQYLASAEHVDQTLLAERQRAVLLRFGRRNDPTTATVDVLLHEAAHELWLYCVIYLVDLDDVPDFIDVYELYDPCSLMCFYRNKPLVVDVGHGPDTKITWPLYDSGRLADAIIHACQSTRGGTDNESSRQRGFFVGAFQGLFFGMPL